jgi:hypothetical protein
VTDPVDVAAGAFDGLADRLRDAVAEMRGLVAEVAEDWPDARGRAWADRAELMHRDLDRQAEEAGRLARLVERLVQEITDAAGHREPGPAGGPVLPGVDAVRVVEVRGMRLATLPEAPP